MKSKRGFAITILMAALLALVGLAAACGDDDDAGANTPTASATAAAPTDVAPTDVQVSIDEITAMVSAAEADDLAAAQVAFDAAHDPLHEVIEALEDVDSDLATQLDEAVDDAESDLEDGEEAEHIVEVGNDILGLLQAAAAEIGS